MSDSEFTNKLIDFSTNVLKEDFYNREFKIYNIIHMQDRKFYIDYFNLYKKSEQNKERRIAETLGIYFIPPFVMVSIISGFLIYNFYDYFYFDSINKVGIFFSITKMPEKQYLLKGYFFIFIILYTLMVLFLARKYFVIVRNFDSWKNFFLYYADIIVVSFVILVLLLAAPMVEVLSTYSNVTRYDFDISPAGIINYFCLLFFIVFFLIYRLCYFSLFFSRKSEMDAITTSIASSYAFYKFCEK